MSMPQVRFQIGQENSWKSTAGRGNYSVDNLTLAIYQPSIIMCSGKGLGKDEQGMSTHVRVEKREDNAGVCEWL